VIAAFPGARITKTRPAVVLSTAVYQRYRPDVILGLITTRPPDPLCPTDCEITDWKAAGLHAPSCFRLYLVTLLQRNVRVVGRLADNDWNEVRQRVQLGIVGAEADSSW
jgi:mRNA-degrading endonuclease toxin of MazEF toxin-antitoxin module